MIRLAQSSSNFDALDPELAVYRLDADELPSGCAGCVGCVGNNGPDPPGKNNGRVILPTGTTLSKSCLNIWTSVPVVVVALIGIVLLINTCASALHALFLLKSLAPLSVSSSSNNKPT